MKKEKKISKTVALKDERIHQLENMLQNQSENERELKKANDRVRASELYILNNVFTLLYYFFSYAFLTKRNGLSDASSIDAFITKAGDINEKEFMALLTS